MLPRSKSEVLYIYREIFEQGVYGRRGIEIKDGDCIVDVGANIGLFALFALQGRTNLHLTCLEPLPPIFAALSANLNTDTTAGHRVDLVNEGISLRDEEAELVFYPASPGNSTAVPDKKEEEGQLIASSLTMGDFWRRSKWLFVGMLLLFPFRRWIVRTKIQNQFGDSLRFPCRLRPLGDLIDERGIERIDLLKVDVEGSELSVLDSIRDDQWPMIRQLVMEVSPHLVSQIPSLRERLEGYGFAEISVLEDAGSLDVDPGSRDGRSLPCTLYARR
ncbi:MAG: FkbM family methyltransferase [Acidobacteriota bacterium]